MFYENFIFLCNKIGKSPSAVAIELGISKPAVTRWKNGSYPTDAMLRRIADFFDVSLDKLTGKRLSENEQGNRGTTIQFSKVFKQICKEKGITQKQALSDIGMGRNAVQAWAEGSPSMETLIRIASYFGMTIDEVFEKSQFKATKLEVVVSQHNHSIDSANFSTVFMQLCKKRGISQKQALADLGLSRNAAQRWAEGMPSSDTLQRIAEYFGISTDFLLEECSGKTPAVSKDMRDYLKFIEAFENADSYIQEAILILLKLR